MNCKLVGSVVAFLAAGLGCNQVEGQAPTAALTGWVRTKDGKDVEGAMEAASLTFAVAGTTRQVALKDVLSFHSAEAASAFEAQRIAADLTAVAAADFKAAEAAVAELTDIGLPAMTPLLKSYADTDAREPDPRYRLFARIIPGYADATDRTLDLVRLADGDVFRGKWTPVDLKLKDSDGKETTIPAASVRRLAMRRASVDRTFAMQALHDCTYVAFVDTGIAVTKASQLRADSVGYVRLSFDEDGWATDPDGIKEPLPGKRKLQEGFRWGSVLGRVGYPGERWFAGKHVEKADLGSGRLYFVINDNEHFQNNIGSYRVRLNVINAYDLGDAQ